MDDREDLFEPYEYSKEDLADICSDIKDSINFEADGGECSFKVISLSARYISEDELRVSCKYCPTEDLYAEDRSSFTVKLSLHTPVEDSIYDALAENLA